MKKTITFIINPISGGKNKNNISNLINTIIDTERYKIDIYIPTNEEDTLLKVERAVANKTDAIIAVGGDGTLNNLGQYVRNSDVLLGVIPMGSGNGFARSVGIPMDLSKSIEIINNWKFKTIDTGTINDKFFINLTGVGFDAHVSGLFANSTTRGFNTYAQITFTEYINYKSQNYTITIDKNVTQHKAFLMCVCNGNQFGNDAFIAPNAVTDDGYFNISIVENFKLWQTPEIGVRLFNKTLDKMDFIKSYKGKEISITRDNDDAVNIDGEPVFMGKELTIKVLPKSIKIIIP